MLIVLSCILFAPFTAKAHIADCHIDISDNYLENEFLGKTLDELTQSYAVKEFEVSRFGAEWTETRLDICGNYELALWFDDKERVRSVYSEEPIYRFGDMDVFNIPLSKVEDTLKNGKLTWDWHEGPEIYYRFSSSNMSFSYGWTDDAEACLEQLEKCAIADSRYARSIFTYK